MEARIMHSDPNCSKIILANRKVLSDIFGFTHLLELPFEPGLGSVDASSHGKLVLNSIIFDEESTNQEQLGVRDELRRRGKVLDVEYPYFLECFVPRIASVLVNQTLENVSVTTVAAIKVSLSYLFVGDPSELEVIDTLFGCLEPKQYTSLGNRKIVARDVNAEIQQHM